MRLPYSRPASAALPVILAALLGLGSAPSSAQAAAKRAKISKKKEAPAPPVEEVVPVTPSVPPAGSSPIADLRKSNTALKKLFQKKAPSWSPEVDAKRGEMREIVAGFLDFDELGRRALARHWTGLSPQQRNEFVTTLRDLIERNYIKQVHGAPDYKVDFEKEAITGSEATVSSTLHASPKGKKVEVPLEYRLLFKGKRWLVYDVITDEQSMLENYRAEFNRIIVKESFDALLRRMKKKLEDKAN